MTISIETLLVIALTTFVVTFIVSYVCLTVYNIGCTVYRKLYTNR